MRNDINPVINAFECLHENFPINYPRLQEDLDFSTTHLLQFGLGNFVCRQVSESYLCKKNYCTLSSSSQVL